MHHSYSSYVMLVFFSNFFLKLNLLKTILVEYLRYNFFVPAFNVLLLLKCSVNLFCGVEFNANFSNYIIMKLSFVCTYFNIINHLAIDFNQML